MSVMSAMPVMSGGTGVGGKGTLGYGATPGRRESKLLELPSHGAGPRGSILQPGLPKFNVSGASSRRTSCMPIDSGFIDHLPPTEEETQNDLGGGGPVPGLF